MTTSFSSSDTQIVEEMIQRLRALQGIDEQVPPGRRVIAGAGLEGGGTLEGDVTLTLAKNIQDAVNALVSAGGAQNLVTAKSLQSSLAQYAKIAMLPKPVVTHDFSLMEAPVERVIAPPVVVDSRATVVKLGVTCSTPGSQAVVVTLDGKRFTMSPGVRKQTFTPGTVKQTGELMNLSVESTDASGILVAIRMEEG